MNKTKFKKFLKIAFGVIITIFVLFNIVIIIHAYSLSHYKEGIEPLTPDYKPSFSESVHIALCGLDLPKPLANKYPVSPYDSLYITTQDDTQLSAWLVYTDTVKQGLAIVFHGYMEEKSSMLDRAEALLCIGYDVLLVDFMGAGNSSGNQTTMGYLEAENVKAAHDYAVEHLCEDNIVLVGFSMGSTAIMKAQYDHNLLVKAIILEAPYATFAETVNARLDVYHMPHFLTSKLFVFWFGAINGFNAFEANPQDYAKKIDVPVLIMSGGKDPYISENEIQRIFDSLASENKESKIFPESKHETYLLKYPEEWCETVSEFLNEFKKMDVYYE